MPYPGMALMACAIGLEFWRMDCGWLEVTGANTDVVRLFAIFHDSRRVNECTDCGHGQRGAELAAQLRGDMFDLPDTEFQLLDAACAGHEHGMIDASVTVQTCWDADRLDLGRVGMRLDPTKLCTDAARQREIMRWADGRAAFEVVPEIVTREWDMPHLGGNCSVAPSITSA